MRALRTGMATITSVDHVSAQAARSDFARTLSADFPQAGGLTTGSLFLHMTSVPVEGGSDMVAEEECSVIDLVEGIFKGTAIV